jgi:hypothetical protein
MLVLEVICAIPLAWLMVRLSMVWINLLLDEAADEEVSAFLLPWMAAIAGGIFSHVISQIGGIFANFAVILGPIAALSLIWAIVLLVCSIRSVISLWQRFRQYERSCHKTRRRS